MPEPMRRSRWEPVPGSYPDSPVERSRRDLHEAILEYVSWGNRRPADPLAFKVMEAAQALLVNLEDLGGSCGACGAHEDGEAGPCPIHEGPEEPPRETAPLRVTPWGFFRKAPWRVKVAVLRRGLLWAGVNVLGLLKTYAWPWCVLTAGTVSGILAARLLGVMP